MNGPLRKETPGSSLKRRTLCIMRIIASSALLVLFVAMPALSGEKPGPSAEPGSNEGMAVYAKILLPVKAPARGGDFAVESWIARKLRKRGVTEFRAVTGWVVLAAKGEAVTHLWDATLDGKRCGCPVTGRVSERSADGRLHVSLSGWSPFGADVKGNSLAAGIGCRRMAVVDTGRVDGMEFYVALFVGPNKERTGTIESQDSD